MRLIINADDYGWNQNCTNAIAECMRKGWITNTTLMVTMPETERAVELARSGGFLNRIGLHLNIYGGVSLTEDIRQCPSFYGADGLFNHAFCQGVRKAWTPLSTMERSALIKEVSAQFERYIALGLPVRHFDSHHHSHMIMRVLPAICEVAEMHGFKTARRGVNVANRAALKSKVYYAIQDYMQCRILQRHGLSLTRYMCDFQNFMEHFQKYRTEDTVELMVHPFYAKDGKLNDSGEMSDSGLRPMREVVDFISSNRSKIRLVSFKEFAESISV